MVHSCVVPLTTFAAQLELFSYNDLLILSSVMRPKRTDTGVELMAWAAEQSVLKKDLACLRDLGDLVSDGFDLKSAPRST
jgi:hypothetical protein